MRKLYLLLLCLWLSIPLSVLASEPPTDNLPSDIIGTWNVKMIEFTDCPEVMRDMSIDLNDSNCFMTDDGLELCVQMSLNFEANGTLTQSFKTYENGVLTENKIEKSRYTIGNNRIMICDEENTSCETSLIEVDNNKLLIMGRDVANKCYILLKSTK